MNKKTTPSFASSASKQCTSDRNVPTRPPHPSEKTLAFLRSFAHNYRVEPRLPQSLQGIILG